jgi:hypothetical protein
MQQLPELSRRWNGVAPFWGRDKLTKKTQKSNRQPGTANSNNEEHHAMNENKLDKKTKTNWQTQDENTTW